MMARAVRLPLGALGRQLVEDRLAIPMPARSAALRPLRRLGLTDESRHERLMAAVRVDVLLDLDGEYLGRAHLLVEVLDDAAQLAGNLVGDEHEPQPVRREVRAHPVPKAVGVIGVEGPGESSTSSRRPSLYRSSGEPRRPDAVRSTLSRWRRFWGAAPTGGLTGEEIRGLLGELWFLAVWLLPHGNNQLGHWLGPTGTRHDFQWPQLAVEAKATTSGRGHLHRINGLDQLDPPADGRLLLFSLRMREEATASNTLLSLIETITTAIGDDGQALDGLESRLVQAGYSPLEADHYAEIRFRVINDASTKSASRSRASPWPVRRRPAVRHRTRRLRDQPRRLPRRDDRHVADRVRTARRLGDRRPNGLAVRPRLTASFHSPTR